jgi:hypothetical protein
MMTTNCAVKRLSSVLGLVVAAAAALTASQAQAGTVSYPDVTLNNVVLTNIQETNALAGNVALYGAPTATADGNGIVFNTSQNPFTVSAANGLSADLVGTLTFTVTFLPLTPPTAGTPGVTVNEDGTFSSVGASTGTVTPTVTLTSLGGGLLDSVIGTTNPSGPFMGTSGPTKVAFTWTGQAAAAGIDRQTGYNVSLSNDLNVQSIEGGSAQLDKKQVTINFCTDCSGAVPEPASLGLLGLGALPLLLRRRKA